MFQVSIFDSISNVSIFHCFRASNYKTIEIPKIVDTLGCLGLCSHRRLPSRNLSRKRPQSKVQRALQSPLQSPLPSHQPNVSQSLQLRQPRNGQSSRSAFVGLTFSFATALDSWDRCDSVLHRWVCVFTHLVLTRTDWSDSSGKYSAAFQPLSFVFQGLNFWSCNFKPVSSSPGKPCPPKHKF